MKLLFKSAAFAAGFLLSSANALDVPDGPSGTHDHVRGSPGKNSRELSEEATTVAALMEVIASLETRIEVLESASGSKKGPNKKEKIPKELRQEVYELIHASDEEKKNQGQGNGQEEEEEEGNGSRELANHGAEERKLLSNDWCWVSTIAKRYAWTGTVVAHDLHTEYNYWKGCDKCWYGWDWEYLAPEYYNGDIEFWGYCN